MSKEYKQRYATENYVAEVVEPISTTVDEHSAFVEREKTGSFNPLLKCYKYDAYFGHQYDYFDPYWLPFPDTTEVNVPVLLYDLSSLSTNSLKLWSYSTFESYVVQLTAVDGGQTGQYRRLRYYTKTGNYTVSAKLTKDMVTEIGTGNFMYEYSAFGWILYSIVDLASLPEEYVDMFPQKGVYYVRTAEDKNCPARLVWEACVDSVNAFAIPTTIARVADVDEKVSELKEAIADLDVQPDWNQNDETAKDYVKNRPFYTSISTMYTDEFTGEYSGSYNWLEHDTSKIAPYWKEGQSVTVTWNGVEYPLTVRWCSPIGYDGVGNFSIYMPDMPEICEDTGEPFAIWCVGSEGFIVAVPGEEPVTATWKVGVPDVLTDVPIPDKYIPGWVKNATNNVMSKSDPAGTGSFSLNRKEGTEIGYKSFAEGHKTTASAQAAHAEGSNTTASGNYSHAEGCVTTASGAGSHAEGGNTTASGNYSHAEGHGTIARGENSHVQGNYNIEDTGNKYAHIVGNGSTVARSNAHTLDWDGNAWFSGDVYVGSSSGVNKDESSKKLATEDYVSKAIAELPQADMAQNDPTAPDYVKNRLAWTDDPVETVLIAETTNEWTALGFDGALMLDPIEITEGTTYKVNWDGTLYECVSYMTQAGIVAVGNDVVGGAGDTGGNGEPFFITVFNGATMVIADSVGSHVFSVVELAQEVHPFDTKYIPTVPHIDPELTSHVKYSVNLESLFDIPSSAVLDLEKGESIERTLSKKRWDIYSNYVCHADSEVRNLPMVMWSTFICEDIRTDFVEGYRISYSTEENAPCIRLQSFIIDIDYNPETEILACTKRHFIVGRVSANEE